MSGEATFPVEPWRLREVGIDTDQLARTESLFALSNGHLGVRGTLDEGEPNGLPGTYLNSFFESHPLAYPESGYAFPKTGQSVVNVSNGKIIRLLVDDEPFDVRYGRLLQHERILDFRDGTLSRKVEWETPAGQRVRVRSTRLVSLSQRAVLAVRYEVEPVGAGARVVVQSELLTNESLPDPSGDAGADDAVRTHLLADGLSVEGTRACLMHRTRYSDLRMAAAVDHVLAADTDLDPEMASDEHWARLTVSTELQPGQRLTLTKFVAYGWSAERSDIALKDQAEAALAAAVDTGWDGLLAAQREYLDDFWARADVEVDGDQEVQQAVRFGMFHLLQASARAEQRAISAKGLTGTGYAGHAFWETEAFVLPVLTATVPGAAADALRWRRNTLSAAKDWARTLRLRGAAFAWRTIRGEECSSYWPAGTAAFHINADIAVAAARQVHWTQDADFDRDCALPLLVETARLWQCLGYVGADGHFHLDGMTGPDEYTALVNDNTYTNLAAAANLREAAATAERWPEAAADLGVAAEEIAGWRES
ncbi:MAG TPA: family 65 glycosyl hydrolase, partial [Propionibacteriaceae bacterium]|nr:family 65 glycosyl hydrolase [Propionibacteriaceae bacterium]